VHGDYFIGGLQVAGGSGYNQNLGGETMNTELKVLVLDIETAPILAYVWGLHEQEVGLNQIKSDWYVMAWGAKWLKSPEILYRDQRNKKDPSNDKAILTELWALLDQADIVITQNGEKFDGPKLNARFMLNGMNPPSPYRHLDTYKIVKQVAQFTSNKLEYLTDKLCLKHKKITHGQFPGMVLWKECMKNNIKAWDEMKRYNIEDVLSTEELYTKIRPWTPETMPNVHPVDKTKSKCRVCGSSDVVRNGYRFSNHVKFARILCRACGAWSKDKVKEEKKK
jgi:DNA polymerase elongation subunit (family B)